MSFATLHRLGCVFGVSGSVVTAVNTARRFRDTVEGEDSFSRHTADQHRCHRFSGMHDPFIPTEEQRDFFLQHFSQYHHLLPHSLEALKEALVVDASVTIRTLENCPAPFEEQKAGTVVVGGPPALISSANDRNVTYICNEQGSHIHRGSAFHLEWDAASEAPTTYLPSAFMVSEVTRALFNYKSLHAAEKTGQFPWRSLDWSGWLRHPQHWAEGGRIAWAFQKLNQMPGNNREHEVALRCQANQRFYEQLNRDLKGKLLLPHRGSIIVARTEEEERSLQAMSESLQKEGKSLCFLSRADMQLRYGFVPQGVAFAEKMHDATLSPNFMQIIAKRLESLGGKFINGSLTTVYVDNPEKGGVIEYRTSNGGKKYQSFSHLVLSLGNQRILGGDGSPLFDIVSARGVSALGLVYAPRGHRLPPVIVCGGTNHVTKLSEAVPLEVDGKDYDGYLVRMTAAACITPTVLGKDTANYDGVAATGLISAVKQTLGLPVEVFTVYGCNRQVSEYGQSHWLALGSQKNPSGLSKKSLIPSERVKVPAIELSKRGVVSNNTTDEGLLGKLTSSIGLLQPRGHELDQGTYRPLRSCGVDIQMGAGGGGLTQGPAKSPDHKAS